MKMLKCLGRDRTAVTAIIMVAAAGLTACSGDDDSGPNAPPPPTTKSVTLSGRVVDSPIANAAVSVTVGDQTFATSADADGNYQVELEIEETDDGFVSVSATGVGDQAHVELVSLLGTFDALDAQAGLDGVLSREENNATYVTNVTTAEAILMQEANGGAPITTDSDLEALGAEVNGQEVLELATAIKLVVDQGYALPAGVTSTLELASSAAVRDEFIADAQESDAEAFSSTQQEMATDPNLSQPVDDVPSELTLAKLSSESGFTFNYSGRIKAFTFANDNTGTAFDGFANTGTTWTADGSQLTVTYATPQESTSFDTVDCNGNTQQVETTYSSGGVVLSFLSDRTVAVTTTYDVAYPGCPSIPARQQTDTEALTILEESDYQAFTADDIANRVLTLNVYEPTLAVQPFGSDIMTFAADGTGTSDLLAKSFTWSVAGNALTVDFGGGVVGTYRNLRTVDDVASDVIFLFETPAGPYADAGASMEVDPAAIPTVTAQTVPARYYQFGIGEESAPGTILKGFALRFDADGGGSQESDRFDTNDDYVLDDDSQNPWLAFRWAVEEETVAVRRTYHWDGVAATPDCAVGSDSCFVWDERVIIPLVADGVRNYWIEKRRMDDFGIGDTTPFTLLARFYDREELTAVAAKAASPGPARKRDAAGARLR